MGEGGKRGGNGRKVAEAEGGQIKKGTRNERAG